MKNKRCRMLEGACQKKKDLMLWFAVLSNLEFCIVLKRIIFSQLELFSNFSFANSQRFRAHTANGGGFQSLQNFTKSAKKKIEYIFILKKHSIFIFDLTFLNAIFFFSLLKTISINICFTASPKAYSEIFSY